MTIAAGLSVLMCLVAWMPSIRGMFTSMTTTSGERPIAFFHRFFAVGRLSDDGDVLIGIEDAFQPLPDHSMIVQQKHPHLRLWIEFGMLSAGG